MSQVCRQNTQYVCYCLRVTEDDLSRAAAETVLRHIDDIASHTGAGEGCRACRARLEAFLTAIELEKASAVA